MVLRLDIPDTFMLKFDPMSTFTSDGDKRRAISASAAGGS